MFLFDTKRAITHRVPALMPAVTMLVIVAALNVVTLNRAALGVAPLVNSSPQSEPFQPVQSDNDYNNAEMIARKAFIDFLDDNELEFESEDAEVEVEAQDPKENLEVEIKSLQITSGMATAELVITAPFSFEAEIKGEGEEDELEIEGDIDLSIHVNASAIIEQQGESAVVRPRIDTLDIQLEELSDVEPDDIDDLEALVEEQLDSVEDDLRTALNAWFAANPMEEE